MDDLPGWLPGWCLAHLGGEPVGVSFQLEQTSTVCGLRWRGHRLWAVHDWDSLAWQPEAALVGAASGAFARASGQPTLAPVDSSDAFLATYHQARERVFTAVELQVAWAASVWPAAHNARWEALHGQPPVCGTALRAQAAERLRRAGA